MVLSAGTLHIKKGGGGAKRKGPAVTSIDLYIQECAAMCTICKEYIIDSV